MIKYDKNFNGNLIIQFIIHPQSGYAWGQVQFCHNLIVNFFKK